MKFVCEHCNSKYNIADEKVRNKILKIRCKKCSEIIEIRDPAMKDSPKKESGKPASRPAPTGSKQSKAIGAVEPSKKKGGSVLEDRFKASFKGEKLGASGKGGAGTPGLYKAVQKSAEKIDKDDADFVVWFVAIDEKPVGPISPRGIFRHRSKKRVTDDSLVWKEGMPDWLQLRNCKELVGLLARLEIESTLDGPVAKAGAPAEKKPGPKLGLFEEEGQKAPSKASPLKGGNLGVLGERLDVAKGLEKQDGIDWGEAGEESFERPEPIIEQKTRTRDDLSEDFSLGMESSVAQLKSIYPVRPKGGDRWVKIAAIGFFVVALVVLVVIIAMPGASTEQQVVEKVVEKFIEVEKEKIVYRDRPRVEGDDQGEGDSQDGAGDGSGTQARQGVKKASKEKSDEETAEERKKRLLAQMGMSAPVGDQKLVGGTSGKESGGSGSGGGAALSESQLAGVVNKNKARLQICYEQAIKKGEAPEDKDVKVLLKLKVGPSGMVKSVGVGGSGGKLQGLRTCLEQSVKKWMFPSSFGESSVEFPFLFTPK